MDVLRVNYDELEEDPEWIWEFFYLYRGEPFTGIAYESWPNGQLMVEEEIKNGRPEGFSREWYSSGIMKREGYETLDGRYGWWYGWFENGRPKSEQHYEWRITVKEKLWNEAGELISDYERPDQGKL